MALGAGPVRRCEAPSSRPKSRQRPGGRSVARSQAPVVVELVSVARPLRRPPTRAVEGAAGLEGVVHAMEVGIRSSTMRSMDKASNLRHAEGSERRALMGKKIGVILSGCGVYDGSEIHEAVITLLAIDRLGAEAVMCAPNVPQMHVVNHLSGEVEAGASRNVLVESARIARGKIRDLAEVRAEEFDAVMLPGGFGAAKNLCDFAVKGKDCEVRPEVARLIREVHAQGKPVAAVCIAPAVLAKVLGA